MDEWIKLNVGGQIFLTTKRTLLSEPNSMLANMFSGEFSPGAKDEQGAYMIDRTPEYFKPILNYLRTKELIMDQNISKNGVLAEARYFGIQGLVDQIEEMEKKRIPESLKPTFERMARNYVNSGGSSQRYATARSNNSGSSSDQRFLNL